MKIKTRATSELLADVEALQNVQRSHASVTPEWRHASRQLKPRFRELARRQRAGAP